MKIWVVTRQFQITNENIKTDTEITHSQNINS